MVRLPEFFRDKRVEATAAMPLENLGSQVQNYDSGNPSGGGGQ